MPGSGGCSGMNAKGFVGTSMRYLSVCSGIEAASVAWHPLGWEAVAYAEVDAFPSAVLAHRFPGVPNWGDMTKFEEWPDADVDVLVGGTPCQSFSVAGKRAGMDDPRGQLAHCFAGIAARYRPEWIVWENVPGVLSSNGGRDFAGFLRGLGEFGYQCAWRVLDAQYFGVAQRRRRVFVVGHLGDWRRAAAVLFEREGMRGDPAPRREAGEGVAGESSSGAGGGIAPSFWNGEQVSQTLDAVLAKGQVMPEKNRFPAVLIPFDTTQITSATNRSQPKAGDPCHPVVAGGHVPAVAFHGAQDPDISGDVTHPAGRNGGLETCAMVGSRVRRLTPRECERLQGCPDDWTLVPYRGKPAADSPRYKAIGNSMAVPCMRWIGERMDMVATC